MASIQDQKSTFYSHKQSVRDESLAPQYLESAGDVLIKNLVKKQLKTSTTLEEQLLVSQNFEKGFNLNPDNVQGITSLANLKSQIVEDENKNKNNITDKGLKSERTSCLSRHELELSLCEKPNSKISKLYQFAMENKQKQDKVRLPEFQMPNHPINHLAEIEEEHFGHLNYQNKKPKTESIIIEQNSEELKKKVSKKRRKHRKRKKKNDSSLEETPDASFTSKLLKPGVDSTHNEVIEKEESVAGSSCRLSLWDVKDMKKWCQPEKVYGCKPQTYYTIKDGKIVKLESYKKENDIT